jgi:hypothetical protein
MAAVLHSLMRAAVRRAVCALTVLLLQAPVTKAAFTELVSFGTASGFAVDPNVTTAAYVQSTNALIFSPSIIFAATIGGSFDNAPYNWSDYNADAGFAVKISILSGDNPNLPFSLSLVDAAGNILNLVGTTVGATLDSYVALTLNEMDPGFLGVLLGVTEAQFTWDGGAPAANVAVQSIVASPPSTGGSFTARAPGGVRFLTSTNDTAGVQLTAGAWESLSDSNAKTGVTAIDHRENLRKLSALPVTSWQYKHNTSRRYVGPMAQDFHAAFVLGHDDKNISTLDIDGVALSALKGLLEKLQERKNRSASQAKRLAELEAELLALGERLRGARTSARAE